MVWRDKATSHYLNQWRLDNRRIHASLGFNELSQFTALVFSMWLLQCCNGIPVRSRFLNGVIGINLIIFFLVWPGTSHRILAIKSNYIWCALYSFYYWIVRGKVKLCVSRRRHQMETFSALPGHLCGEFTGHRWIPRTKASDTELWCSLICALNKRLSKQSWGWWFKSPFRPLWRHCNDLCHSYAWAYLFPTFVIMSEGLDDIWSISVLSAPLGSIFFVILKGFQLFTNNASWPQN